MVPNTPEQWQAWVAALPESELWSKTVAANSMAFTTRLQQEGRTLPEIQHVLELLVRRLVGAQLKIPEGGMYDLQEMARRAP